MKHRPKVKFEIGMTVMLTNYGFSHFKKINARKGRALPEWIKPGWRGQVIALGVEGIAQVRAIASGNTLGVSSQMVKEIAQ